MLLEQRGFPVMKGALVRSHYNQGVVTALTESCQRIRRELAVRELFESWRFKCDDACGLER